MLCSPFLFGHGHPPRVVVSVNTGRNVKLTFAAMICVLACCLLVGWHVAWPQWGSGRWWWEGGGWAARSPSSALPVGSIHLPDDDTRRPATQASSQLSVVGRSCGVEERERETRGRRMCHYPGSVLVFLQKTHGPLESFPVVTGGQTLPACNVPVVVAITPSKKHGWVSCGTCVTYINACSKRNMIAVPFAWQGQQAVVDETSPTKGAIQRKQASTLFLPCFCYQRYRSLLSCVASSRESRSRLLVTTRNKQQEELLLLLLLLLLLQRQ